MSQCVVCIASTKRYIALIETEGDYANTTRGEMLRRRSKMTEEKKYLKELVAQVERHLLEIDKIMKLPESNKRGELIAQSCNNLNLKKDLAKRYGLGLDFKGKKLKRG